MQLKRYLNGLQEIKDGEYRQHVLAGCVAVPDVMTCASFSCVCLLHTLCSTTAASAFNYCSTRNSFVRAGFACCLEVSLAGHPGIASGVTADVTDCRCGSSVPQLCLLSLVCILLISDDTAHAGRGCYPQYRCTP